MAHPRCRSGNSNERPRTHTPRTRRTSVSNIDDNGIVHFQGRELDLTSNPRAWENWKIYMQQVTQKHSQSLRLPGTTGHSSPHQQSSRSSNASADTEIENFEATPTDLNRLARRRAYNQERRIEDANSLGSPATKQRSGQSNKEPPLRQGLQSKRGDGGR